MNGLDLYSACHGTQSALQKPLLINTSVIPVEVSYIVATAALRRTEGGLAANSRQPPPHISSHLYPFKRGRVGKQEVLWTSVAEWLSRSSNN